MTAPYPDADWPCSVAFHRGDDEPCDAPGCWLRSNVFDRTVTASPQTGHEPDDNGSAPLGGES